MDHRNHRDTNQCLRRHRHRSGCWLQCVSGSYSDDYSRSGWLDQSLPSAWYWMWHSFRSVPSRRRPFCGPGRWYSVGLAVWAGRREKWSQWRQLESSDAAAQYRWVDHVHCPDTEDVALFPRHPHRYRDHCKQFCRYAPPGNLDSWRYPIHPVVHLSVANCWEWKPHNVPPSRHNDCWSANRRNGVQSHYPLRWWNIYIYKPCHTLPISARLTLCVRDQCHPGKLLLLRIHAAHDAIAEIVATVGSRRQQVGAFSRRRRTGLRLWCRGLTLIAPNRLLADCATVGAANLQGNVLKEREHTC